LTGVGKYLKIKTAFKVYSRRKPVMDTDTGRLEGRWRICDEFSEKECE
jgi:hypothetical protein